MTADLHHLAAPYALDALDEDETRAFEDFYPDCPTCTADVAEFRETTARLAASVATEPPAAVRERVFAEIANVRQIAPSVPAGVVDLAERKRRNLPRKRILAFAAAAVVAVAGFLAGLQIASVERDNPDELLLAGDARTTALVGDAGVATVVWSASQDRGVLVADGLAEPGEGKSYELWLIDSQGPNPTGLFKPDGGSVRVAVDLDGRSPAAWGITIEPETGSDTPTGEILLVGETT